MQKLEQIQKAALARYTEILHKLDTEASWCFDITHSPYAHQLTLYIELTIPMAVPGIRDTRYRLVVWTDGEDEEIRVFFKHKSRQKDRWEDDSRPWDFVQAKQPCCVNKAKNYISLCPHCAGKELIRFINEIDALCVKGMLQPLP